MPTKHPLHHWFEDAEVGQTWAYPKDQRVGGRRIFNTRGSVAAMRDYYQRKLGRKFSVRVDAETESIVVERLPDDATSYPGRPKDDSGTQEGHRRRQAAYRARKREKFIYAMSAEGFNDTSDPDYITIRKRAAFQMANTAALAQQGFESSGRDPNYRFRISKENAGEIHHDLMRAAQLIAGKVSKEGDWLVELEQNETNVAGNLYTHWLLTWVRPHRQPEAQDNLPEPGNVSSEPYIADSYITVAKVVQLNEQPAAAEPAGRVADPDRPALLDQIFGVQE